MRRTFLGLWLLIVAAAAAYVGVHLARGLALESSILALLPRDEQDAGLQRAADRVAAGFARRVVLLVGHRDAAAASAAGRALATALQDSGLARSLTGLVDAEVQRQIGAAYFPYRAGLLAPRDREQLAAGEGTLLAERALALVYGPGGAADGRLLAHDPFLLLPSFFASLPLPQSRLVVSNGILGVRDGELSYAFISAELQGDPFAQIFQDRVAAFLDHEFAALSAQFPGLELLRTGAIFYAAESTREARWETSLLGGVSLLGTLILVLAVFRRARPVLLSLLAIGVGILCAMGASLLIFRQLHAIALLFGVSLIGISVDYCLQYFCEYFDGEAHDGHERLRRVITGVALGLGTTLIGYLTFLLTPFPLLQQISAFSACGLVGSCLTVALLYPPLDRGGPVRHGARLVALAGGHWAFWQGRRWDALRRFVVLACLVLGVVGLFVLHVDDDIRHMQSLPPELKAEELRIQSLTGIGAGTQFLLIEGADDEALLETEERLAPTLASAERDGLLAGAQTVAQFVPSLARQRENRRLVQDALYAPFLADYLGQLGFSGTIDTGMEAPFLAPAQLPRQGPLALAASLILDDGGRPLHLALLQGVRDAEALRTRVTETGVRLVSPAEDYSRLFAKYRERAVMLLAFSALLMLPMLAWRYGWLDALCVMAPSVAALLLAAPIAALFGVRFTFFNAMALVLVLSIGVDYAVFCRETAGARKPVTMLAVALAALCTMLSFGLLALSRVFAVHAFGLTMLIGIALAFLLAPAAGDGEARAARGKRA